MVNIKVGWPSSYPTCNDMQTTKFNHLSDKQVIPGIYSNRLQRNIKEHDKTIVANIDDKSKNFKQLL